MTRILTAEQVSAVLGAEDCIRAVEEVFRAYGAGRIGAPRSLGFDVEDGSFHVKAARTDLFAAKINANFPSNPGRHGLPTIQGVIVLFDPNRGTPLAVLDSTRITALRTAAATAVAAKHLARRDSRTLAVIGCGTQAAAHLEALALVLPLSRAFAYDAASGVAERFARENRSARGVEIAVSGSVDEAVAAADVVVTCTPARSPFLHPRHRRDGLFVAAIGADHPEKNEVAPELLAACRIVPDSLEQAAAMGDLHHALAAGLPAREYVHGELAEVVCGKIPGRTDDSEVFVFDSTGTALQDAAAASVAYSRAVERGVGSEIALA